MTIQTTYFPMVGGMNLESPPLATSPGELVDASNYECLPNGGYRRILGYTLYDGQTTPSQAVPGTGDVLGLHIYKGELYAIREDGTNGRLYKATASGWSEVDNTFTWSLGGTYNFCNYNFYGQDAQEEMFIANGVDKAVKYDGTALTQITTGSGSDNPKAVIGHRFHLFLAVESSLVNSATGDPTDYTALNGAAEIAVGDTISDLIIAKGALIIACEDSTYVLYGNDATDFSLDRLNATGSYANTLGNIGGQIIGLDRQGVMSLSTSSAYGNFDYASLTQKVKQIVTLFGSDSRAILNKSTNQYRLFNGKVGLYFTFSGTTLVGISRVVIDHPVTAMVAGLDSTRQEVSYFGSSDGNVYKMDSGYTFAGNPIYSYLVTSFHHFGGPTRNKRFRLIQPDIRVEGAATTLGIRASSEYGGGEVSRYTTENIVSTGGALWDYNTWDSFTWDSLYHQDAHARMSITGTNIAVIISSDGSANGTHTVYGISIHYSPRRLKR